MNDTLIIGIATVDAIARPIDEFPGPGGLRFFEHLTMSTGGCAINCSIALAKLGIPCDVIARVGTDMLGDFVVAELARHGVATGAVARDPQVGTAFTFAAVAGHGERCFLHTVGADARLCRADVPPQAFRGRRLVFVTGTMLMDSLDGEPTAEVLSEARSAGAATLLDTVFVESTPTAEWRRRVFPALRHVDFFVPSEPEARALYGTNEDDKPEQSPAPDQSRDRKGAVVEPGMGTAPSRSPLSSASPSTSPLGAPAIPSQDDLSRMARCFQSRGARNVIIKLGARGVFCLTEDGREQLVPAFPVPRVIDTTGAGDCWSAGFLAGLLENLAMPEAARLGNAVAAQGIQAAGATAGVQPLAVIREFMAGRGGQGI